MMAVVVDWWGSLSSASPDATMVGRSYTGDGSSGGRMMNMIMMMMLMVVLVVVLILVVVLVGW